MPVKNDYGYLPHPDEGPPTAFTAYVPTTVQVKTVAHSHAFNVKMAHKRHGVGSITNLACKRCKNQFGWSYDFSPNQEERDGRFCCHLAKVSTSPDTAVPFSQVLEARLVCRLFRDAFYPSNCSGLLGMRVTLHAIRRPIRKTEAMEAAEASLLRELQHSLGTIHIESCLDHELCTAAQRRLWLEGDWVERIATTKLAKMQAETVSHLHTIRREAQAAAKLINDPNAPSSRQRDRKSGSGAPWYKKMALEVAPLQLTSKEDIEWFLPLSPCATQEAHAVLANCKEEESQSQSTHHGYIDRNLAPTSASPTGSGYGSPRSPGAEENDSARVLHLKRERERIDQLKEEAAAAMEASGILPSHLAEAEAFRRQSVVEAAFEVSPPLATCRIEGTRRVRGET